MFLDDLKFVAMKFNFHIGLEIPINHTNIESKKMQHNPTVQNLKAENLDVWVLCI